MPCAFSRPPYLAPSNIIFCFACRISFQEDTSQFILHTMERTHQYGMLTESENPPTGSPQDFADIALDILPNPTDAGPSHLHDELQQADFNQGQSQVISDLIVGPSNFPHEPTALHVQSNAKVVGVVTARGFNFFSDERMKNNIVPSELSALSALEKIGVYQYQMNQDPQGDKEFGVLAQELRHHLPDTVELDAATGFLKVKLDKLLVHVLKGVQEANEALKHLDAKQPMGMPVMIQSALVSHESNSAGSEGNVNTNSAVDSSDASMSDADADNSPQQVSPMPTVIPAFKDDIAMIQHIMAELGEKNPGMPVKVHKLLDVLGRTVVWETFQHAQKTSVLAQDGEPRSPGSAFFILLKQQQSSQKSRQAHKALLSNPCNYTSLMKCILMPCFVHVPIESALAAMQLCNRQFCDCCRS